MGSEGLSREDGETSYNKDDLFRDVNNAVERWKQNDLYQNRLEVRDFSGEVRSFDDLKRLPTVDMREFKQHPEELVIDREDVSEEYALYSSGTTSDSQSYTLRSEQGYKRHKTNFQNFAEFLFPELDRMHSISPTEKSIEKLPEAQAKRAVFTYPQWIFEHLDTEYYVEMRNGGMAPDIEGLIENIEGEQGSQGVFSTPNNLYKVARKLDEQNVSLDLGENGMILTAGGWKGETSSNKTEFRSLLRDVFGVTSEEHLDFYGCTELFFASGNKYGDENPDMKRVAPSGYVWIADEKQFLKTGELEPVEEGEPGLLVAIDPSNTDYPGVLLTDDVMRKVGGEYGENVRIEYIGRSSMG